MTSIVKFIFCSFNLLIYIISLLCNLNPKSIKTFEAHISFLQRRSRNFIFLMLFLKNSALNHILFLLILSFNLKSLRPIRSWIAGSPHEYTVEGFRMITKSFLRNIAWNLFYKVLKKATYVLLFMSYVA